MARILVYYAHPGHRFSHANRAMLAAATETEGVQVVDLYREYPRFNIKVDREQTRLVEHDIVLFQYPLFWYSTPSLIKEWLDLVLEHGFAYGSGGDRLKGKVCMLAITAAGPEEAYSEHGYQGYPIRTLLTPMERTAKLCGMSFPAPYVLFGALHARTDNRLGPHVEGYRVLLSALRDDRIDLDRAETLDVLTAQSLPLLQEA